MKKKATKPYWEMSARELALATKEFDRPVPESNLRRLSRKERALFERLQRGPHRSIYLTNSGDAVLVRIDPKLLSWSAKYGEKHRLTLSDIINRSLKGMAAIVD